MGLARRFHIRWFVALGFVTISLLLAMHYSLVAGIHPSVVARAAGSADAKTMLLFFSGDSLDDVTRILRPLQVTSATSPAFQLSLRDVLYLGGSASNADILTVWTKAANNGDNPVFRRSDSTQPTQKILARLSTGPLRGEDFLLVPVHLSWKDWKLTFTRTGTSVGYGPSANDYERLMYSTPPEMKVVSTASVIIPLGFGQSRLTAWIPYFRSTAVSIRVLLHPTDPTLLPEPDLSIFQGRSGVAFGESYLNEVFSTDLQDRRWTVIAAGKTYTIKNLTFINATSKLQLSGNIVEVPAMSIQATLTGSDLAPAGLKLTVNPAGLSPTEFSSESAQAYILQNALSALLHWNGTPIRPGGAVPLGGFAVGTLDLNGVMEVNDLQSLDQQLLVSGSWRISRGTIQ